MFKKMFVLSTFIFAGLYSSAYAQNVQRQVHDVDFVQVKKILEKAQNKTFTVQETKVLLQELFVHEQPETLEAFLENLLAGGLLEDLVVCVVSSVLSGVVAVGLGILLEMPPFSFGFAVGVGLGIFEEIHTPISF